MTLDDSRAAWRFTPTKWHTVADKEKFARHYIKFVQARCPFEMFHRWFYERLTLLFMHIAHYNRFGFYETWCDTAEKRFAFVRHHVTFESVGDAMWTWSDVERTLKGWILESGILREYEFEASTARRQTTLAIAKAALSELADDDVARLVQERGTSANMCNVENKTRAITQTSMRAEQQQLISTGLERKESLCNRNSI